MMGHRSMDWLGLVGRRRRRWRLIGRSVTVVAIATSSRASAGGNIIHQLHDRLEVVLSAGGVAEPLVLLRTEARMAHGHVASVGPRERVLRGGAVVLVQVVLHHARVRPVAHKLRGAVVGTLEVHLRNWPRVAHPGEHLLEGDEPDILHGEQMVEELVEGAHVASTKSRSS